MKSRKSIQASEYSNFLKQNPTIDEVLNHDKTVDEVCCSNPEFSTYLTPERLRELIRYIIEEPSDPQNTIKSCKYPLIASEFFTADLPIVAKILFQEPSLMTYLFSFLESEPLNFLLSGYFLKAYECCLAHNSDEFMLIIFQENYHSGLLKQMKSSSIAEIVASILTQSMNKEDKERFLVDVARLVASREKLTSYNATGIVAKITKEDSLFTVLTQDPVLPSLLFNLRSSHPWVVRNSSLILKGLFQASADDLIPFIRPEILSLSELLLNSQYTLTLQTQFGLTIPTIGEARLSILDLFVSLCSTTTLIPEISPVLPRILTLFPQFHWSTLFHNTFFSLIEVIITNSIQSYIEILSIHNFPQVLISLAKENTIKGAKFLVPLGCIGHVYKLINLFVNSKIPSISSSLEEYESWPDFESKLQSYNEIEAKNIGGKATFNFFENMSSDSFDKTEEPDLIPDYPNAKPMTGKELEELTELFDFEDKKTQSNPFMSTKVVKNASLEELKANEYLDNLYWKVPIDHHNLEDIN